jgi:hypothetical protein
MVAQSLSSFDQAEVSNDAVVAAAHASQPGILEPLHDATMHQTFIPSIPAQISSGSSARSWEAGVRRSGADGTGGAPGRQRPGDDLSSHVRTTAASLRRSIIGFLDFSKS